MGLLTLTVGFDDGSGGLALRYLYALRMVGTPPLTFAVDYCPMYEVDAADAS